MTVPSYIAYSKDRAYKRIDGRKQLFLDNDIIAVVRDIKRTFHQPAKHKANPLICQDKPWEQFIYFRTSNYSVQYDKHDKKFKCWYEDLPEGRTYLAYQMYAESQDGIHWEKPPVTCPRELYQSLC